MTGIRRHWHIALTVTATGLLAIAVLAFVPILVHPPLTQTDLAGVASPERRIELGHARANLQDGVRTSLLQAMAGLVIVVGAVATWSQVRVSREGHTTEQLSRAVDQVGHANLDIRIGGLYALERIARTSPDDHPTVVFMLTAFVRNHTPWPGSTGSHPTAEVDTTLPWLRVRLPDVQAAMNVLGRRSLSHTSQARLYLARTDLRSLQINDRARLSNANFNHANLARAWLHGVILDRSEFRHCDLRLANLGRASLRSTDLRHAILRGANLRNADLTSANLCGADLSDADLTGATLTKAHTDASTVWPRDRCAAAPADG